MRASMHGFNMTIRPEMHRNYKHSLSQWARPILFSTVAKPVKLSKTARTMASHIHSFQCQPRFSAMTAGVVSSQVLGLRLPKRL